MTAINYIRQSLGYIHVHVHVYRSDHAHEAALINTKGDTFCGGETKSASRMCPPGQNPLADSVRGDRIS